MRKDVTKKILIITHGKLAEGFASAIKILTGFDNLSFINAYVEDEEVNIDEEIKSFVESVEATDEGIIFTDLFGGSVNQKVMRMAQCLNPNIVIITQVNLPIILQILLCNEILTKEKIKEMIDQSPIELIDSSYLSNQIVEQSEEDFING